MPARDVPALTDLLCESCGYTLNGLPDTGNCPECGQPVAASTTQAGRGPTAYEVRPSIQTFWLVTRQVLLSPKVFYRNLSVRDETRVSWAFAMRHRLLVGFICMLTLFGHLMVTGTLAGVRVAGGTLTELIVSLVVGAMSVPILIGITRLAGWLSSLEAGFWGMRLPLTVVRRAMDYHSAAYLPVALVAFVIVFGYMALTMAGTIDLTTLPTYLYVIAGYVVVSAAYLFRMFVIAMMGVRYANQ
ncbi:MAG: hypothetical protein QM770_22410 [Tepidisphaeraceae bacterium]